MLTAQLANANSLQPKPDNSLGMRQKCHYRSDLSVCPKIANRQISNLNSLHTTANSLPRDTNSLARKGTRNATNVHTSDEMTKPRLQQGVYTTNKQESTRRMSR